MVLYLTDLRKNKYALVVLILLTGILIYAAALATEETSIIEKKILEVKCRISATSQCYNDLLIKKLHENGAVYAQLYLKKLWSGRLVKPWVCHQLSHTLGREALKKYVDIETTLLYEMGACSNGYTHGILEELFNNEGTSHGVAFQRALEECASEVKKPRLGCVHGIGHGLMYSNGHDLNTTLKACDQIGKTELRAGCHDGAFMAAADLFFDQSAQEKNSMVKKGDPFYTCSVVGESYKKICYWRYSVNTIFYVHQDPDDLLSNVRVAALSVPEKYRNLFWNGVGRNLSFDRLEDRKVINLCDLFAGPERLGCLGGAALHIATTLRKGQAGLNKFCSLIPDKTTENLCYKNNELVKNYPASLN